MLWGNNFDLWLGEMFLWTLAILRVHKTVSGRLFSALCPSRWQSPYPDVLSPLPFLYSWNAKCTYFISVSASVISMWLARDPLHSHLCHLSKPKTCCVCSRSKIGAFWALVNWEAELQLRHIQMSFLLILVSYWKPLEDYQKSYLWIGNRLVI